MLRWHGNTFALSALCVGKQGPVSSTFVSCQLSWRICTMPTPPCRSLRYSISLEPRSCHQMLWLHC